ncbi:MAG: cbb3-type cytochrome c oxidase subunit I [Bacteroidia bacterium]|nr:cbb3-type cytochrome c oxidase subunit I [Bacteroidia bacterium]
MEQYPSHKDYSRLFIKTGLIFLLSTLLFGLLGAIEYVVPGFLKDVFSFTKIRPLHVSSAIFWILTCAIGSIIYYMHEDQYAIRRYNNLIRVVFWILALTFFGILLSYVFGVFGGREYWEFDPIFSIPITVSWAIFIFVFVAGIKTLKNQPVYVWMWLTGAVFFLFTYLESNSWLLPQVRNNLVKDMTIQWKSYGSLVGAWNQLVYGTSIYLMDKIAGNKKYSFSKIAFGLYFLGVFNLMFNWGHHVYVLPTQPYVKHIGYLVSMTELLLLGRIIYLWKSSLTTAKKNFNIIPYKFLFAADVWVFLTLILAIAMSVPALNVYMHGTHVIVGHTMGATIGINTMLLLAFAFDILGYAPHKEKQIKTGYLVANLALLIFWLTLIVEGFLKTYYLFAQPDMSYSVMMYKLLPWFYLFLISGIVCIGGLLMVVLPLLKAKKN